MTPGSPTGSLTRPESRSRELAPSCGTFREPVVRQRLPVPTGWTCCAGSASSGPSEVPWDRASRIEARDFSRWLQVAGQPRRPHWRRPSDAGRWAAGGKPYAPSVRAHSETVLRSFYGFHRDIGTGPVLNPFPLDRARHGRRAHAHSNPMEPARNDRAGLYRPRVPERVPRSIPDEEFNQIFARLPSHRDRALVAFYVSTGARASELLSTWQAGADPGRQLISVVRKGTCEVQELPASTDAFVWLRLYQLEMDDAIPRGRRLPLWWTLRSPSRPLTYHAAHLTGRDSFPSPTKRCCTGPTGQRRSICSGPVSTTRAPASWETGSMTRC